jgi:hypothetical protein
MTLIKDKQAFHDRFHMKEISHRIHTRALPPLGSVVE